MAISVEIKKRLGDFSLEVAFEAGNETLALFGASGCGKSMTLKCIAGVEKPDSGEIAVDGRILFNSKRNIDVPAQRRRVGLMFQNYALFPNMTVSQNIIAGLCRSKERADKRVKLAGYIKSFCLEGLENHYPFQLSGGQQQRAALARMLAAEPEAIMLDEPLSALDGFLGWQLERELAEVMDRFGGTAIYVSHNRGEVRRLCSSVCVMDGGKCEAPIDVKSLFEAPPTIAAALLAGCRNFSRAKKTGASQVLAVDWGCTLECARLAPDDIAFVGIHSDRLGNTETPNKIECRVLRRVEDISHTELTLKPLRCLEGSKFSLIGMELDDIDGKGPVTGDLLTIGIAPEDIMLLRKNGG